jgi:hypothetical protein
VQIGKSGPQHRDDFLEMLAKIGSRRLLMVNSIWGEMLVYSREITPVESALHEIPSKGLVRFL